MRKNRAIFDNSAVKTQPKSTPTADTSSFDIVKATQYGAFDRVRQLVEESGYDVLKPDSENVTLLHWAAINNRQEIVNYLLKQGADINAIGGELER